MKARNYNVKKLSPQYVSGFVDGEGCFCVSVSKHKTLKRRLEVRPEFEIELREDDAEILHRIKATIGCGNIYRLEYKRYDWAPHVKLKVTRIKDLAEIVIPFFDKHPLQAKKAEVFKIFRKIVFMMKDKKHLTDEGFDEIIKLREEMRAFSKKHYRNR